MFVQLLLINQILSGFTEILVKLHVFVLIPCCILIAIGLSVSVCSLQTAKKVNWSQRRCRWFFLYHCLMDDDNSPYIVAIDLPLHYFVKDSQSFLYRFLDLPCHHTMSAQAALEEVLLQQHEYSQAYTPSNNTSTPQHNKSAADKTSMHSNSLYETGVLIAMSALCLSHTLTLWWQACTTTTDGNLYWTRKDLFLAPTSFIYHCNKSLK